MTEWKIKRGESEFAAANLEMLREWAVAGKLASSDLIFHPTLERWMYAKEVEEIRTLLPAPAPPPGSEKPKMTCGLALAIVIIGALLQLVPGGTWIGLVVISCGAVVFVIWIIQNANRPIGGPPQKGREPVPPPREP